MRLFNSSNLPVKACITFFTVVTAITFEVQGQDDNVRSQANQKVHEFRQRMWQKIGEEKRSQFNFRVPEEFEDEIRVFFAGLDSSEMRLEAMGMMESHFFPGTRLVSGGLAVELLEPLIRDADPAVRIKAASAIGANSCGARYAKELIALIEGEPSDKALRNVAYGMSTSGHQPFVKHLEKMLSHTDQSVRVRAALALTRSQLAPVAAFNHNLRLLDDKDPEVRSIAIHNISRPPGNVVVSSLIRMLDDEDHGVRADAVDALAQMGNYSRSIAPLLKDPSAHVRREAARVMGLMADFSYLDDLRPLLEDEDSRVRESAARSVGQLDALRSR